MSVRPDDAYPRPFTRTLPGPRKRAPLDDRDGSLDWRFHLEGHAGNCRVRGTTIPVSWINTLSLFLGAEEIQAAHPKLSKEDVDACQLYEQEQIAARMAEVEAAEPIPWGERIVSNARICGGKWTIKGTRIGVAIIHDYMLAGETDESLLANYPSLELEDLEECRRFVRALDEGRVPSSHHRPWSWPWSHLIAAKPRAPLDEIFFHDTEVTVADVRARLAQGLSDDEILAELARIGEDDLQACRTYLHERELANGELT